MVFIYHGSQKLFGIFGGSGVGGFTQYLQSFGIPYPQVNAWLAGGSDFFCGLALFFGLFARWAVFPLISNMGTAIFYVMGKNGFNIIQKGYEHNMVLIAVLTVIPLVGSGRYSIKG